MINNPNLNSRPETKKVLFYGYVVAFAAFFIILVAYGVRFSYGVFFTPMAESLQLSSATTSAVYSISMILEGIFSLVFGGLADRYGPKVILTGCAILVGVSYALIPLVHSAWQLYLFYGVMLGIGMGGMFVPVISMTAKWFTARRSLMTGLVSSGSGIGILIISPLSSRLIASHGWQTTYLIMGVIIFAVVIVAAQFLKRDPSSIGVVAYGENDGNHKAQIISPAGFTFREALHTWQFWFIFSMVFWFGFYSTAVNVHIVPDAIKSGISPESAANILAVGGAVLIIGRIGLGTVADRIGNKSIFIIGFILSALALFWIAGTTLYWAFFVFAAVIGFAQGGIGTSQSPLIATLFGLKSHGLIYGLVGFSFTLGAALGPYVTGYIYDYTASYNLALIISAIASVIALVFAFLIKPIKSAPFLTTRL